jgi:hypothetical protein
VDQHGRTTLAVFAGRSAKRKTPKGGTTRAFAPGRTRGLGRTRENLSKRRRCKKRTAGLGTKSNLRVKRRDPWHRANGPTKSDADPALSGEDAEKNSQPCLDLVCKPVAQPPARDSTGRRRGRLQAEAPVRSLVKKLAKHSCRKAACFRSRRLITG